MERDDPAALKRVAQAAIARAAAAMAPKKAAEAKPLEPLGLEVPGAPLDLDGERLVACTARFAQCKRFVHVNSHCDLHRHCLQM